MPFLSLHDNINLMVFIYSASFFILLFKCINEVLSLNKKKRCFN